MNLVARSCCVSLALLAAAVPSARACTLWAEVTATGTLISKNRDWKPDHVQVLKRVADGKGYAFFGLYAEGNDEPGLKQGVNEKGLCVVSATAGSIPKETRNAQSSRPGALTTLLTKYASCDEVLRDQDKLFGGRRPAFYLVSDRNKVLTVEIGLAGKFVIKATDAGSVAHTNHYVAAEMAHCNLKIGASSATRYNRISTLLRESPGPHSVAMYAAMSKDRHDGVDNSLWRTGKNGATLSSWILETPREGSPKLRVLLANPRQPERTETFVLNEEFWRGKRSVATSR